MLPPTSLRVGRVAGALLASTPRAGRRHGPAVARRPTPATPASQRVLATRRGSHRVRGAAPKASQRPDPVDAPGQPSTAAPAPPATLSLPALLALAATCASAALPAPLLAAATAPPAADYDPTAGSDVLKNVAGAAYVVLIIVFAVRLLRRRAATATSQRFASSSQATGASAAAAAAPTRRRETARATPANAAWAAAQAGACAAALYAVCLGVDAFFEGRDLPDAYSARNIAVTLRTIGRGLAYLLTFIFGANAVGLAGE